MKKLSQKLNWRYAVMRLTHKQFLAVILIILTTGFQTVQGQVTKKRTEKKMTLEQNKQVVIKFNKEFFQCGNTEITKELLSDSFTNHTASPNAPKDASAMIMFITAFHKGFSNISVRIDEVLAEADKVSLRKTITAIHTGEFMGKTATGKKVEMNVIEIDILKDGKITDHWSRNDFIQIVQGL
ncbi:ester cyclase [Flavobacterium sp. Root186]|uniref:ester cyclase n=1 Tax=Flavobacterium sp. Root186 TaxID=1736485 RepID=UPI0006F81851|nr:ester cyclase [Flavobacterium sp. Root186]KRB58530.1 hypothetical protein ASD98_23570 [Flavobacterium sp. Root186]